jgi:hypothetical protein
MGLTMGFFFQARLILKFSLNELILREIPPRAFNLFVFWAVKNLYL